MCNVLIIEDQVEAIERYKALAKNTALTFFSHEDVGLINALLDSSKSIEEQIAEILKSIIAQHKIDLVFLDTDLSRDIGLQTHSSYKSALLNLGMPVCRYQKGGRDISLAMLPQLQRTIRDGPSAIWIPRSFVSGDRLDELVPRLIAISNGFQAITNALVRNSHLLETPHSPADVLAAVLGDSESSYEFLGYAAQNLVYFAKSEEDAQKYLISSSLRYATQLGYWLFNYIIAFPGPILNRSAAAAYLNVQPGEIEKYPALERLMEPARYKGPFANIEPYYWRTKLLELLEFHNGDIVQCAELKGLIIERVDPGTPGTQAYVCMLSGEAITASEAAVNPDWIPSGASEAKIKGDVLDELGPLAGV